MKFSWGNFTKPLDPIEITALVIFLLYLVFPVNTPPQLANVINTSIGILILIGVTVYLFLNTHPVVAILYIFVAYELIRRSMSSYDAKSSFRTTNTNTSRTTNSFPTTSLSPVSIDDQTAILDTEQSIPNLDHNYATIGENSRVISDEHAAELARLNPPSPYGNTLEEDVIRERDPEAAARMHPIMQNLGSSSSFVPVYCKGSDGVFDL